MGRWRSNQSAAGIDARTINGHRTDVIALSPTAKEKSKPPVPPPSVSTWAKRIEYVPTCAIANPVFTAPFGGSPTSSEANDTLTSLPVTATTVSTASTGQWLASSCGLMSMPTETKKIAPKTCRTGSINFSTSAPRVDSATRQPARNAPSTTVYPARSAIIANAKHSPRLVINSVSGRLNRATPRTRYGTVISPIAITTMMNEVRRLTSVESAWNDSTSPFANVISTANINMAMTSSHKTTPNTSWRTLGSTCTSSKVLATMTAPEIDTIAPVTRLCHWVQPIRRPTK